MQVKCYEQNLAYMSVQSTLVRILHPARWNNRGLTHLLAQQLKNGHTMWNSSFQGISHQAAKESDPRDMGKPWSTSRWMLMYVGDIAGLESERGNPGRLGLSSWAEKSELEDRETGSLSLQGRVLVMRELLRERSSRDLRRVCPSPVYEETDWGRRTQPHGSEGTALKLKPFLPPVWRTESVPGCWLECLEASCFGRKWAQPKCCSVHVSQSLKARLDIPVSMLSVFQSKG